MTNPEVRFQLSHQDLVWKPGELWYGDFSFPHRLRNRGTEARVHLVLDLAVTPSIMALFTPEVIDQRAQRRGARARCEHWIKPYNSIFFGRQYRRLVEARAERIIPKVGAARRPPDSRRIAGKE